jgi:AAA family ATP:ADP antiporter
VPYLGFVFYVWVGIFSLAMIAQFWSYANDLYDKDGGERLFPIIGVGATAGSAVGSYVAKLLFENGFGAYNMLQVAAGLLLVHFVLYLVVFKSREAMRDGGHGHERLEGAGGFALILQRKYLRLLALLLLLLNLVNTTGEFILASYVEGMAGQAGAAALAADPSADVDAVKDAFVGSFYGEFFLYVNVAGVLLQALVVSRIVKYTGLAGVLLMLPIVSLGAYTLVAFGVSFSLFRWAKTAENSTDYSVMNTARAMLWLPTTRDEKYKAKQALDTFVVRVGDLISGGLVFVGTEYLEFEVTSFAMANVVVVIVWLAIAWLLYREYRRLSATET